ncbi:MAG TPA: hypothetical protein VMJ10_04490 [Kofleriaceae bacterium]|nr:hypothetical protein [Kofleriaceae bacterium]
MRGLALLAIAHTDHVRAIELDPACGGGDSVPPRVLDDWRDAPTAL